MKELVREITVSWAHCDAAGIVFYPNFYIWFDQATEHLFSENSLSYEELEQEFNISGMPLVENGTEYMNACKLGARLIMTSRVDEWARKTFIVKHRVEHSNGKIALEGFERRVMVIKDPTSEWGIKAIDVPEEIRCRFF